MDRQSAITVVPTTPPSCCKVLNTALLSACSVGAMAARAAMHSTMAMMNVARFVNLRLQYDETEITTATMSRYPVVSHCTVAVETVNSPMSTGSSTFVIVSVRMPTKAMIPVAMIDRLRLRDMTVGN